MTPEATASILFALIISFTPFVTFVVVRFNISCFFFVSFFAVFEWTSSHTYSTQIPSPLPTLLLLLFFFFDLFPYFVSSCQLRSHLVSVHQGARGGTSWAYAHVDRTQMMIPSTAHFRPKVCLLLFIPFPSRKRKVVGEERTIIESNLLPHVDSRKPSQWDAHSLRSTSGGWYCPAKSAAEG